jgi:hypothetical protein
MEFDLSINSSDLNILRKQLEEAPMLFWYYSNQLEDYKRKATNLKLRLDVLEATIASSIRRNSQGEKVSEVKINRLLYEVPEYIALLEQHHQSIEDVGKAEAIVKALYQRHSIMITLSSLVRQEMRQLL